VQSQKFSVSVQSKTLMQGFSTTVGRPSKLLGNKWSATDLRQNWRHGMPAERHAGDATRVRIAIVGDASTSPSTHALPPVVPKAAGSSTHTA
jgi:hypothetical protein